jgi:predicted dehydrogenase
VVKQNRYNPPVAEVKRLITEKKLGKVNMVVVNGYWNRNEAYYNQTNWRGTADLDGGVLFTQFSHFVDVLYYLFGDITNVKGQVANFAHPAIEIEDSGNFTFEFVAGGMGSFNYTTCSFQQNMEGSISIFADNGTIKIGGKYLNTIDYQCTNGFDITDIEMSNSSNNYGFYEGSMSNHDKVIDNVIQTLNHQAKVMTNGYEGLTVVKMINKFYDAAKR